MIRESLTSVFEEIAKTLNSKPVKKQVDQVKKNFEQSVTTLYKTQDQIQAGFKQVSDTVTDVSTNVEGSVPTQVQSQIGISQLDKTASDELVSDVGSDRSDLQTITGKNSLAEDGFLDVVISAPFAEALAATLKDRTTLNGKQVADIVKNNVNKETGEDPNVEDINVNEVNNIVGNLFPDFQSVNSQRNNALSSISSNTERLLRQSSQGFATLIENAVEQTFQPAEKLIKSVASGQIPKPDVEKIISLSSQGNYNEAAKILKRYSDKTINELESTLIKINNKASNQITESKTPRNLKVKRTDALTNLWREERTENLSDVFSPIIGTEVTAEVLNLSREVTEIVVMFMEEAGATIESYHQKYSEKYGIGFNPHFYIGYDAIIYRGRPLEIEAKSSTSTITNDHYKRSIIIGVNVDDKKYQHKFAPNQREKLLLLIDQILEAKPGLQVYSAKDVGWNYNEGTDALDVSLFVKQKLNKMNLADYDPKTNPPLTQQQLARFNRT